MVAILHDDAERSGPAAAPEVRARSRRPSRPARAARSARPTEAARPALRLLHEPDAARGVAAATYRRRRVAAASLAVAVVALAVLAAPPAMTAVGSLIGPPAAASGVGAADGAAAGSSVRARPGDTLWSIAERLPHHGDVRALVDQLVALNGGVAIRAGQRVLVPKT